MKLGTWRKRWIQLLGIVLCILAAIIAGYIICFLAQHLVLLYLTGAAILLFFYRVLFYKKPEQRRKEKAQKQEQKRWKQHRCFPHSGRARAAYLILCVEEVLRYYRLDFTRWDRLLEILWDITQTNDVWEWVAYTSNLDPETITSCQDWVEWEENGDWEEPLPDRYRLFEEEFSILQEEYRALPPLADTILCQLLDCLGNAVTEDLLQEETPNSPSSAMYYIRQAEIVVACNGIPLPQNERALAFLMQQKDKHWGSPFDGLSLSALAPQRPEQAKADHDKQSES